MIGKNISNAFDVFKSSKISKTNNALNKINSSSFADDILNSTNNINFLKSNLQDKL